MMPYSLSGPLSNIAQTNQIKLNGIPIRRATVRSSVNISPARLEFEKNDQSIASYQVCRTASVVDWLM